MSVLPLSSPTMLPSAKSSVSHCLQLVRSHFRPRRERADRVLLDFAFPDFVHAEGEERVLVGAADGDAGDSAAVGDGEDDLSRAGQDLFGLDRRRRVLRRVICFRINNTTAGERSDEPLQVRVTGAVGPRIDPCSGLTLIYEPTTKRPAKVDHNAITGEELRLRHAEHFQKMDEHICELSTKFGKTVMIIAPDPQAVIALREKIMAGQAPGLKTQEDLFTDELGHGKPPLMALVSYVDYATIYRRSPVGLPVPAILKQAKLGDQEESLNRLLQELAWEAVVQHPLSGVQR